MATRAQDTRRAAAVQRRSAGQQKQLAREYGITPSVVSRWQQRAHSPLVKELRTVRRFAQNERLNPWPLLIEAIAVVAEERYRGWTVEQLVRRACALYDAEHDLEAAENRAGALRLAGGCRETHRRTVLDESCAQIELVAIDYVLEEREADWARDAIRLHARRDG